MPVKSASRRSRKAVGRKPTDQQVVLSYFHSAFALDGIKHKALMAALERAEKKGGRLSKAMIVHVLRVLSWIEDRLHGGGCTFSVDPNSVGSDIADTLEYKLTKQDWRKMPKWQRDYVKRECERSARQIELYGLLQAKGKLVNNDKPVDWSIF